MSNTNVTVTVQDPTGQAWADGSISYRIAGTKPVFFNGVPLADVWFTKQTVKLDGSGSAAFALPDNSQMTPFGQMWQLTVNPNAYTTGITVYIAITGAAMDISAVINNAIQQPSVVPLTVPFAYADSNILLQNGVGELYYNTGAEVGLRVYTGIAWRQVDSGGGGGGTPGAPVGAVQYNNGGAFGGDSHFTYDPASQSLVLVGTATTGDLHITGSMFDSGNATINGDTTVGGNASVTGTSSLEGDTAIGGNASVSGTLTTGQLATLQLLRVLTTTELDGGVTIGSTLAVVGLAALQGGVTVTGNAIIDGLATISGLVTINNNLNVNGNVSAFDLFSNQNLTVGQAASIGTTLNVLGATALNAAVAIPIAGKTYAAPAIQQVTGVGLNQVHQNASTMTRQQSITYTTSGSSTGFATVNVGPTNPPVNAVLRVENTASVSGAEIPMTFALPPGWFCQVIPGSGEVTGIGRWFEWDIP